MADDAPDFKKILTEYHSALLKVQQDWASRKLGEPQQNFAATRAAGEFIKVIHEFQSKHGDLFKD